MIILFSLADAKYFRYIKALVRSSREYFPDSIFHIFLVNVDKECIMQLTGINNCMISTEKRNFSNELEKKCYCASRRGFLFTKLRRRYPNAHLVWIDSDSVFIKNAESFKKHILSCDVSMRPKNLILGKFASGVIISGPNSIDFFNEYYNKINKRINLNDWTSDQKMLNLNYRQFKDKINFKSLPKIFCDVWYSNEGVLWVAKGKCRNNSRYQMEIKKWI